MKKDTLKDLGASVLISAAAVPMLGVLAHVMHSGAFSQNDATLADRFECAYNMNPKNKTFVSYQYVGKDVLDAWLDPAGNPMNEDAMSLPDAWIEDYNEVPGYVKFCNEEEYAENPFVTAATYLGVAGLAFAGLRRRRNKMIEQKKNQMSR